MSIFLLKHKKRKNSIDKDAQLLYDYGMSTLDFLDRIKINSCGITECGRSWHWDTGKSGFHDFDLWLVVQGKGRIIAGEKSFEVTRGACLLLLPETHYVGEHDTEHPFTIMNVHFSAPDGALSPYCDGTSPLIYRAVNDLTYFCGLLRRVVRLYNAAQKALAATVFRAALAEYFSLFPAIRDGENGESKAEIIQKMCDRVNTAPESAPPLSDFSAQFSYSADYLGKLFSRDVGISYSDYVANARVNKAKFLLCSSALSLEEISEELRYYDVCHFSRQFKRITGTSPGKYRKEAIQKNK